MRPNIRALSAIVASAALWVILTAGVMAIAPGCSTPNRTAYVVEGTVINTADTALNVWLDLVVAGKVSIQQEMAFRDKWNKYLAAQRVVQALVENQKPGEPIDRPIWKVAIQGVSAASADVIAFVGQFGKKS